jgi:hypothetical protein
MRGTAGAGRLFWVLLALPHILIVSRPVIFAGCTVIVQVCQIRAFSERKWTGTMITLKYYTLAPIRRTEIQSLSGEL